MNPDTLEIANRLRKLRISKGINQKEFAKKTGINPVQYNRYEKGETLPSTETLAKLADALDVSVDYLYDGEEQDAAVANFSDKELLKLFQEVENFSPDEKNHIKFLITAIVKNRKYQEISIAS